MTLVWSGGNPVLIDDRVHSFSSNMGADYGAVSSVGEYYADRAGLVNTDPDAIWKTQPWVRTVVELLASSVATTRIHSFKRDSKGDRKRVTDSPLAKVLRRPNPGPVTGYDWRHHLVVDRAKWGRYACLITNVTGGDDGWRLTRIPPRQWTFVRNSMDEPIAIRKADGSFLSLDRVLFFDGYPAAEKSPMDCIADLLLEEAETALARRDLMKNGARIPHTITRPADADQWSPKARDNFKRSWQAFAKGGARSGMTPVLEDGMELHEVKLMSFADAQQIESRTLSRREVIAFFLVAPQLVGDVEGNSYLGVTAHAELLHVVTLGKWYCELEDGINDRLTPVVAPAGDEYAEFNVAMHLRLAFEKQADAESKELAGVPQSTVNEVRARKNMPALPGGDELIIPINIRPAAQDVTGNA